MIQNDTEIMNMIANCYDRLKEYDKCLEWLEETLCIDSLNEEGKKHKKALDSFLSKIRN